MRALTLDATDPPRRFDRALWNQLTSLDHRLLDELAYLSRLTARRSPSRATYCYPGRRWLADRLGCSIETVSDHVSRLATLGLLHRTQRRPRDGRFQTNLYRLVHPMAWMAARVRQLITKTARRVPRMTHIASVQRTERVSSTATESLRDIIARGLAKFAPT